ncbi:CPBP family intramembrane metalloprotease [Pseudomonas sp. gcc21]|uniref:CPBP family intramembrane glutamic endopeptidase n=1 Tax=Pseudomonas sp. gcc21 TaxID=2726989 RepID=UPI0014515C68|nr:CPBP family intramembrane glutamic endopeptidase [Pseudomonas sp. gcc21]QJD57982.1 CPBP family intramembrane metalloprotease [Pseudomonas sp. gcc21]
MALPRPSRSALDDGLILMRLAVLYSALGLISHYFAAWTMRQVGQQFHIDSQFLMLDALFAASVMLGSLLIAWLLQPAAPLRWLFGAHISLRGVLLAVLGATVMVYAAEPLAGWFDLRLPDSVLLPEDQARPQAVTPLLDLTGSRLFAALLIAVLWVPAAEELIFRGWLFKALAQTRPGVLVALPASTLIFALLHGFYSPGGVLVIGLLGLFLGWLRWRYDQLWLCVLAHAVYNGLTLLMVAIQ